MLLLVSSQSGEFAQVEVDGADLVADMMAILEVQLGVPMLQQQILANGTVLHPQRTVESYGLQDDQMLELRTIPAVGGGSGQPSAAQLAALLAGAQVPSQTQPAAQPAFDASSIAALLGAAQVPSGRGRGAGAAQPAAGIPYDPMDPEFQRKLHEQIQQQNINENYENAVEHTPESFARVIMLYIDCEVNKHKIKAFVDSGAQSTIMSKQFAEKCNLMHLCDVRFAGMAHGVGTSKILGRIHMTEMKIGNIVVPVSITVLEQDNMDFLLGLDMLRRHQMCIDLHKNVLRVGDTEAPFLHEKDLPSHYKNEPLVRVPSEGSPMGTAEDEKMSHLVGLGFDPEQARAALKSCGGDAQQAASMLFQQSEMQQ